MEFTVQTTTIILWDSIITHIFLSLGVSVPLTGMEFAVRRATMTAVVITRPCVDMGPV